MKARKKNIYMTGALILIIVATIIFFIISREDGREGYNGTFVRKNIQYVEDMTDLL